jgi:glycosyltransferase involved in cell wall biosynthesis
MASAAVVHGPHYRATVAAYCPGPVEVIPLCFPDTGKARRKKALSTGRRVTIFGMINDHKQPRRVLEAIALLGERVGGVELHLAGACEDHYRDALLRLAEQLGIASPIFHGYVPDERLQDLVEDSHAICCLRNPVTEGSSASLATALYRGRPLIISDIASFSLVPDDVAYKVSYGDDSNDVAAALREIFTAPQLAQKKAARATKWAKDRFAATTYADAFEPVLIAARQNAALMNAARTLVPALSTADHEPTMPAIHEFARVLDWMEASQK